MGNVFREIVMAPTRTIWKISSSIWYNDRKWRSSILSMDQLWHHLNSSNSLGDVLHGRALDGRAGDGVERQRDVDVVDGVQDLKRTGFEELPWSEKCRNINKVFWHGCRKAKPGWCRVALAQLDPPTFEPKRAVCIVHLNATLAFSSEGE